MDTQRGERERERERERRGRETRTNVQEVEGKEKYENNVALKAARNVGEGGGERKRKGGSRDRERGEVGGRTLKIL